MGMTDQLPHGRTPLDLDGVCLDKRGREVGELIVRNMAERSSRHTSK